MARVLFGSAHFMAVLILFCVVQLIVFRSVLLIVFNQKPASSNLENVGTLRKIDSYRWERRVQRTMGNYMQKTYYEQRSDVRTFKRQRIQKKFESDRAQAGRAPSLEYEKTRRRLRRVVEDFWYFLESQMKSLQEDIRTNHTLTMESITKIFDLGIEYKRILLQEATKLSRVDGYNKWRFREAADLSDLVQRRLRFLQNPRDCRNARKLVCDLRKKCGFGCQLHHVVYCLITAYSTQRTMILFSQGWRYNAEGWETVFQPLSETCKDAVIGNSSLWTGFSDSSQIVYLPIVEFLRDRGHPYLPRAVPKDLAERISKIHEVPAVWWVGQMVKYLMRLNPRTNSMLVEASLNMSFERPIVGVHIRRTDKLNGEAVFHAVDEYMSHVEDFYEQLSYSEKVETKRIYLATDDFRVFEEIRVKYPDYAVIGSSNISEKAARIRYCSECLDDLIVDLHSLANSDFLVCTFSSQVCRVAYEIMQFLHPDATAHFRSLDDSYYFGGGGIHRVVAVMSHRSASADQIDLNIGDYVKVFGNLWNGFSMGFNFRTGQTGLFPSCKVEDVIEAIDFLSTFPQVPLQRSHGVGPQEIQFKIDLFHYSCISTIRIAFNILASVYRHLRQYRRGGMKSRVPLLTAAQVEVHGSRRSGSFHNNAV